MYYNQNVHDFYSLELKKKALHVRKATFESLRGDMIEPRFNRRGNYVLTKKTYAHTEDSLAKLVHFK